MISSAVPPAMRLASSACAPSRLTASSRVVGCSRSRFLIVIAAPRRPRVASWLALELALDALGELLAHLGRLLTEDWLAEGAQLAPERHVGAVGYLGRPIGLGREAQGGGDLDVRAQALVLALGHRLQLARWVQAGDRHLGVGAEGDVGDLRGHGGAVGVLASLLDLRAARDAADHLRRVDDEVPDLLRRGLHGKARFDDHRLTSRATSAERRPARRARAPRAASL